MAQGSLALWMDFAVSNLLTKNIRQLWSTILSTVCLAAESSSIPHNSSRSYSSDLWHKLCQVNQMQDQADFTWVKLSSQPVLSAWSTFLRKQGGGHPSLGSKTNGRDSQEFILKFTKQFCICHSVKETLKGEAEHNTCSNACSSLKRAINSCLVLLVLIKAWCFLRQGHWLYYLRFVQKREDMLEWPVWRGKDWSMREGAKDT